MQDIRTFSHCLSSLMRKHHISISDMTRRLHIKSNTTLSRVLHAECSIQAAENIFAALKDATPLIFSDSEVDALSQTLDICRIGEDAYRANQEMWLLLKDEPVLSAPFHVECYGSGRYGDTTELCNFYASCKSVTIHMLTNISYPMFPEIRDLLIRLAPSDKVHVHHYFSLDTDAYEIIHSLRSALPALRIPTYHGYKMSRPSTFDKEFLSQSYAVIQFQRADETYGTHLLAYSTNQIMVYENDEKTGLFDMMTKRISDQGRWFAPIKDDFFFDINDDILQHAKRMYLQEKDRPLYGIIPDIPFGAVSFELLDILLRDCAAYALALPDALLSELKWVHMQRNRNLFEKKSPSYFITQKTGLRRFAATGLLSLHFTGVRAYTPSERIRILTDCLRRTQEHSSFKLFLACGELSSFTHLDVVCYERLGIQFNSLEDHMHMGSLVTLSEFTKFFQQFYVDSLLGKYVESDVCCQAFIQSLIDELRAGGA